MNTLQPGYLDPEAHFDVLSPDDEEWIEALIAENSELVLALDSIEEKHLPFQHDQKKHGRPGEGIDVHKKYLANRPGKYQSALHDSIIEEIDELYKPPQYGIVEALRDSDTGEKVKIDLGTLPGSAFVQGLGGGKYEFSVFAPDGTVIDEFSFTREGTNNMPAIEKMLMVEIGLYQAFGKQKKFTDDELESEMQNWVETPQLTGTAGLERMLSTPEGIAWTKKNLGPVYKESGVSDTMSFDNWYENGTVTIYRGEGKQAWSYDDTIATPLKSWTFHLETAKRFAEGGGSSFSGGGTTGRVLQATILVSSIVGFWQRDGTWGSEDEVLIGPLDSDEYDVIDEWGTDGEDEEDKSTTKHLPFRHAQESHARIVSGIEKSIVPFETKYKAVRSPLIR